LDDFVHCKSLDGSLVGNVEKFHSAVCGNMDGNELGVGQGLADYLA
jgi:hypothetical protein